jgi:hypothetical protein
MSLLRPLLLKIDVSRKIDVSHSPSKALMREIGKEA